MPLLSSKFFVAVVSTTNVQQRIKKINIQESAIKSSDAAKNRALFEQSPQT